jgi:rfaE bifunctional protein nucleotidyltransferase chain/domain
MRHIDIIYNKIIPRDEIVSLAEKWRANGDKIVFTNGCFDLIHRGHIEYLLRAADLSERMIVGLNTDASVSRLKGKDRPVVDEESRAILMGAFEFVDAVVYFDDDTPYELIKEIQPDILVKGSDYKIEEIIGYDVVLARGGTVETINLVEGFSTTTLIERIKKTI